MLLSCKTWTLKKKRVSVRLVHADLVALPFFLFLFFFFLIFKYSLFAGMTTKFNQGMYARMRAKKNEPLSNLGTKGMQVMEKGIPVTTTTPSIPAVESARTASLATSIKKIPSQRSKRQRTRDKQKEKVDSQSSSVWDDAGVAQARA